MIKIWSNFLSFFLPNSMLLSSSLWAALKVLAHGVFLLIAASKPLVPDVLHVCVACCVRAHTPSVCLSHPLWPMGVIGEYICPMKFCSLQLDSPLLQTPIQQGTDGILMCSMSAGLELRPPTVVSKCPLWKRGVFPSDSGHIHPWAILPVKKEKGH